MNLCRVCTQQQRDSSRVTVRCCECIFMYLVDINDCTPRAIITATASRFDRHRRRGFFFFFPLSVFAAKRQQNKPQIGFKDFKAGGKHTELHINWSPQVHHRSLAPIFFPSQTLIAGLFSGIELTFWGATVAFYFISFSPPHVQLHR